MNIENFKEITPPFLCVKHENSCSICLSDLNFQSQIFQSRVDESVEGNGYDWASLASIYVDKLLPEIG